HVAVQVHVGPAGVDRDLERRGHGVGSSLARGDRPRPTLAPPRGGAGTKSVLGGGRAPGYGRSMKSYGQFCSMARALDLLGERWSLLIVRELLCGSRRFGEVQRGIPRISRTMLAARLRELADAGVIERRAGDGGPEYRLTPAGLELAAVVRELGTWGQRWLPRELRPAELDVRALVWDIHRRGGRGGRPPQAPPRRPHAP